MRSIQRFQSLLPLAILFVLQACASANPIAQAETVEQKAYATYGTFVIFEEQAANLVTAGNLPRGVSLAIIRADERAKPVADSLLDATLEFVEIREEYEAGGVGQTKLISAMNYLGGWIERASPLINNLVSAVKGAK